MSIYYLIGFNGGISSFTFFYKYALSSTVNTPVGPPGFILNFTFRKLRHQWEKPRDLANISVLV